MIEQVTQLHIRALPHTSSSKRGEQFVESLYRLVHKFGYIKHIDRKGKIVGAMSGIGILILTLVVDPNCQRKGIGRELLAMIPGKRIVYTEECTKGFYKKMGFVQILRLGKTILLWRKS